MIRCPICGEENKDDATTCVNCKEPLSGAQETQTEKQGVELHLHEIRSGKEISICHSGIIAREKSDFEPDYFMEDPYLSDPHCEIRYQNDQWLVEDLDSLNYTLRNRNRVMPGFPEILHDGDRLTLADLVFKVVISSPKSSCAEEPKTQEHLCEEEEMVWGIRCPVCGTFFLAENEDSRIENCPACIDELDKERIRFEHPRRVEREKCKLTESFIR